MGLFKKNIKEEIRELLKILENTEFRLEDRKTAEEFLDYNEWGLALDTIIDQLYEYEIKITEGIYNSISAIAKKMEMEESNYIELKKLINEPD